MSWEPPQFIGDIDLRIYSGKLQWRRSIADFSHPHHGGGPWPAKWTEWTDVPSICSSTGKEHICAYIQTDLSVRKYCHACGMQMT